MKNFSPNQKQNMNKAKKKNDDSLNESKESSNKNSKHSVQSKLGYKVSPYQEKKSLHVVKKFTQAESFDETLQNTKKQKQQVKRLQDANKPKQHSKRIKNNFVTEECQKAEIGRLSLPKLSSSKKNSHSLSSIMFASSDEKDKSFKKNKNSFYIIDEKYALKSTVNLSKQKLSSSKNKNISDAIKQKKSKMKGKTKDCPEAKISLNKNDIVKPKVPKRPNLESRINQFVKAELKKEKKFLHRQNHKLPDIFYKEKNQSQECPPYILNESHLDEVRLLIVHIPDSEKGVYMDLFESLADAIKRNIKNKSSSKISESNTISTSKLPPQKTPASTDIFCDKQKNSVLNHKIKRNSSKHEKNDVNSNVQNISTEENISQISFEKIFGEHTYNENASSVELEFEENIDSTEKPNNNVNLVNNENIIYDPKDSEDGFENLYSTSYYDESHSQSFVTIGSSQSINSINSDFEK